MEKSKLNRFISKYTLAGLVESVKWEIVDGELTTHIISDDKSVLGSISMKDFGYEDASFGVYDTTKLTKMLSVKRMIRLNRKDFFKLWFVNVNFKSKLLK